MNLVSFTDVTLTYGSRRVLSHVTLSLPQGAIGLLGPNGAGKTTFIQAMLGLVPVDGGRIEVFGLPVRSSALDIRARVGFVPDRDASIPGLSSVASVIYCGELAGLGRRDAIVRAHDVLSYVGIADARYREVETLSTGIKQRLKLAQALVHDPDLLVLDEPTDGLDPEGRDRMLALISDLGRRHGLNVIVASHLLPDIERTCETVVFLSGGSVAGVGRLDDWTTAVLGHYDIRIKGDEVAFVTALAAAGITASCDGGLVSVTVHAHEGTTPVFTIARQLGVDIRELRAASPDLEDVFIRFRSAEAHAQASGRRLGRT